MDIFNIFKKRKLILTLCLIFLEVLFLFFSLSKFSLASFVCDQGNLNTTCIISSKKTLSNNQLLAGQGNIVIKNNGELTTHNPTDVFFIDIAGNFTIESGGRITGNISELKANNFTLESNSQINLTGKGYRGGTASYPYIYFHGQGPGGGNGGNFAGGAQGGGYGGNGGDGSYYKGGGFAYGSLLQPTDLGSGGGGSGGASGGAGGGKIKITVSQTATINGSILANGQDGNRFSGGGSGGSIWISAYTFAGSGTISSNGGTGGIYYSYYYGGGGGGGRIAVYLTNDTFTGQITAFGGSGHNIGAPGTIYKKKNDWNFGEIYIINNNQTSTITPLYSTDYNFKNITIIGSTLSASGVLTASDNFNISTNGTVTHPQGDSRGITINTTNLNIDRTGKIDVSGQGYKGGHYSYGLNGQGQGGGQGANYYYGANGGGYGGNGGDGYNYKKGGGFAYGSLLQPSDLGSGGGSSGGVSGGAGGGKIKITVSQTATINGFILANGQDGNGFSGGGSGGSIWISAYTFTGSGTISSNGGTGGIYYSYYYGGGGGGGRIAIYRSVDSFSGTISVNGGVGFRNGQTGTLVRQII